MSTLEVKNVSVQVGNKTLISGINLSLKPGEVVSVLGPNGAGKSTLMKVISGERKPSMGEVFINGRNNWTLNERALMLGVLPQSSSLNFPFTAEEVVVLGRIPCATNHAENQQIVSEALAKVDGLHLKESHYTTLSGGERQRIHMARVLAQIWDKCSLGERYLLLDEPTSALDPQHQQLTLKMARQEADNGMGVLVILHDLNLAARYSDRIIMLKEGNIAAEGTPGQVLQSATIQTIFNIDVSVSKHPIHGNPVLINN